MTAEFSLRALTDQVWDQCGSSDRRVLAREIAARILPADRDAALHQALVEYCRQYNTRQRPGWQPATGAGQRNSARSAKVAGIRNAYAKQLQASIATARGQVPLGDCSAADLIYHAELLETQAHSMQVKAAWNRALAAACQQHGVARVRDLPPAALARFLGKAAV